MRRSCGRSSSLLIFIVRLDEWSAERRRRLHNTAFDAKYEKSFGIVILGLSWTALRILLLVTPQTKHLTETLYLSYRHKKHGVNEPYPTRRMHNRK